MKVQHPQHWNETHCEDGISQILTDMYKVTGKYTCNVQTKKRQRQIHVHCEDWHKAVEKDRLARGILELFPKPFLSVAGFKDGQWALQNVNFFTQIISVQLNLHQ